MRSEPANKQRGHILLMAIVLVTLISVMLAMTIQPALTANTRMNERLLIYRGTHMAEGIRRFYYKNGRFPFELDELVEQEPRFVRQLYQDPMTKDGEWTLVYLVPENLNSVQALSDGLNRALGADTGEVNSENEGGKGGLSPTPNSTFRIKNQQITGVRSKSMVEGLTLRNDSRIYADWLFSALPKNTLTTEGTLNLDNGKP